MPLLERLGARQQPAAADLVESLRSFATEAPGAHLNPNEADAVVRLLSFLCTRQVSRGGGQQASDRTVSTAQHARAWRGMLHASGRGAGAGELAGRRHACQTRLVKHARPLAPAMSAGPG